MINILFSGHGGVFNFRYYSAPLIGVKLPSSEVSGYLSLPLLPRTHPRDQQHFCDQHRHLKIAQILLSGIEAYLRDSETARGFFA
jgi:hypothetical protein